MTRRVRSCRVGVTLIELIVAIAVLGIMLGITTLAFTKAKEPAPDGASVSAQIIELRRKAVTSGEAQTSWLRDSSGTKLLTALPDGRVIADLSNLDRLTGTVRSGDAK